MTSRPFAVASEGKEARPHRAHDPRSRAVTSIVSRKSGRVDLHLECGHGVRTIH